MYIQSPAITGETVTIASGKSCGYWGARTHARIYHSFCVTLARLAGANPSFQIHQPYSINPRFGPQSGLKDSMFGSCQYGHGPILREECRYRHQSRQ